MKKVLVIGLDGVPLDLIQTWAAAGKLPTFNSFFTDGTIGDLQSTMPATSATAWSSFMTGLNPAKTGVYDFLYRCPDSYLFHPHNAQSRGGHSLWRLLSDAQKRVGVLNVPMSYPVTPVNGFIIGGWMTPYSKRDFTSPKSLLPQLESKFGPYQIYASTTFSEKNPQKYFSACHRLLEKRTETALYLMREKPWDFFMTVYFDTDRILHQLWHYLDPNHPWRVEAGTTDIDMSEPVLQYFQHLDACLERLVMQVGEETDVIIMSDHGMGASHNFIALNTWLLNQGWLRLKRNPKTWLKKQLYQRGFTLRNVHQLADKLKLAKHAEYRLLYSVDRWLKLAFLSFNDVDWSQSRAYSFGRSTGPIFINVKGREPHGCVAPGREYERVRDELAEQALNMTDPRTGRELVGEVLYKEDLYHGPYLDHAPDLTLIPLLETDKFFGLADFGSNQVVKKMYRYSGMHRDEGMLLMRGPSVKAGARFNNAQIIDLAPTILHLLGVPVPKEMDGRLLTEGFVDGHIWSEERVAAMAFNGAHAYQKGNYTEKEAFLIEERLRQLGYLGE